MILTAHQPNFFPYEGVLDKIRAADVFVVLDHVQFMRRQYQSRFQVGERWFTMSVDAGRGDIIEKRYVAPLHDWRKIKRGLPKYPLDQFDHCIDRSMMGDGTASLSDVNYRIIQHLCLLLGIETPIQFDYPTHLTSTARIVELCTRLGASEYLSGPSGRTYLEERLFAEAGVKLRYFEPKGKRAAVELIR